MKKTYSNPTLKVVKIQTTQILAGSPTPKLSGETTTTMEARRARFSDWDEEEE